MSRSRLRLASSSGAARTSSSSCLIIVPIRMTLAGCSTMVADRRRRRRRRPPSPGGIAIGADRLAVGADDDDLLLASRSPLPGAVMPPSCPGPPTAPATCPAAPSRGGADRSRTGDAPATVVRAWGPGSTSPASAGCSRPGRRLVHVDGPGRRAGARRASPGRSSHGACGCRSPTGAGCSPSSARADALVAARPAGRRRPGRRRARPGSSSGPNMTTLTYRLARALAKTWRPGDEIVVSRLDHDANVRPWLQAAERAGATVRWAEVDIETGELPAWQYDELVTDRTRLVAVTAASNAHRHLAGRAPRSPRRAHAVGRAGLRRRRARRPARAGRRGRARARTSAPLSPTSGAARTSARWSPTRRCSSSCARTSWCPRRTGCPTGSSGARPPFELSPGSAAAVDHLAGLGGDADRHPARAAARLDGGGRGATRASCSPGWTTACAPCAHVQVLGSPQYRRRRPLSFTVSRAAPAAGRRGAGPARGLRLGRRLLRPRAVRRDRGQRERRRGPAGAAALQHRRRGRPASSTRLPPCARVQRSVGGQQQRPCRCARWPRPARCASAARDIGSRAVDDRADRAALDVGHTSCAHRGDDLAPCRRAGRPGASAARWRRPTPACASACRGPARPWCRPACR